MVLIGEGHKQSESDSIATTGRTSGSPIALYAIMEKECAAIARSFVAKAVYNMPTTRALLDRLACDKKLRRICGWERKGEIPSEATFSRAFAEFSETQLPVRVHQALIGSNLPENIVGHISRDSTKKDFCKGLFKETLLWPWGMLAILLPFPL